MPILGSFSSRKWLRRGPPFLGGIGPLSQALPSSQVQGEYDFSRQNDTARVTVTPGAPPRVAQAFDLSGRGRHITPPVLGPESTAVADGANDALHEQNGLHSVRIRTNSNRSLVSSTFTALSGPVTFYAVGWPNTFGSGSGSLTWSKIATTAGTMWMRVNVDNGQVWLNCPNGGLLTFTIPDTAEIQQNFVVIEAHVDGLNTSVFVNDQECELTAGFPNSSLEAVIDHFSFFGEDTGLGAGPREHYIRYFGVCTGLSLAQRQAARQALYDHCHIGPEKYFAASTQTAAITAVTGFVFGWDFSDDTRTIGTLAGGVTSAASYGATAVTGTKSGTGAISRFNIPQYWASGKYTLRFAGDAALDATLPTPLTNWTLVAIVADHMGKTGTLFSADSDNTTLLFDNGTSLLATTDKLHEKMTFSRGTPVDFTRHLSAGSMRVVSLSSDGVLRENGVPINTFTGMGTNTLQNFRLGNNAAGTSPFEGDIGLFAVFDRVLTGADLRSVAEPIAEDFRLNYGNIAQMESDISGLQFTYFIDNHKEVVHPLEWGSFVPDLTWRLSADGLNPGGVYDAVYTNLQDALVAAVAAGTSAKLRWDVNGDAGPIVGASNVSQSTYIINAGLHIRKEPGTTARWVIDSGGIGSAAGFVLGRVNLDAGATSLKIEGGRIQNVGVGWAFNESVRPGIRGFRGHMVVDDMEFSRCLDGVQCGSTNDQYEVHMNNSYVDNCAHPNGFGHGVYFHCKNLFITNSKFTRNTQGMHVKVGRFLVYTWIENIQCLDLEMGQTSADGLDSPLVSQPAQRSLDIQYGGFSVAKNVLIQKHEVKSIGGVGAPLGGFVSLGLGPPMGANATPRWSTHSRFRNWTVITHGLESGAQNPGGEYDGAGSGVIRLIDQLQRHRGPGGNPDLPLVEINDSQLGNMFNNPLLSAKTVVAVASSTYPLTTVGTGNDTTSVLPIDPVNGNFLFASGIGASGPTADATEFMPWS